MNKLFMNKFKQINDVNNYIVNDINDINICVYKEGIMLPSGYYIGGYSSYNTYIVDESGNLVGTIYSSNKDPRNIFDRDWIEIKSRIFKDDIGKENNEDIEKRDLYKEGILRDVSIKLENTCGSVLLMQSINRVLCGNYDFFDNLEEIKQIRPFELEKTMVDTLESIGMDEARYLSFSAIRDTYIEYIKMEINKDKDKGNVKIKS